MPDDDLLARLNALKAPKKPPTGLKSSTPHPSIKPNSEADDLTARFRRLASGDASSPSPLQSRPSVQQDLEDVVATLPSERVENVEDEQSLEDLLRELGESEASWLKQGSEEDQVSDLLNEARAALPQRQETEAQTGDASDQSPEPTQADTQLFEAENEDSARHQNERDEKDADDYIAQVMAEIELQKKQGTYREDDPESEDDRTAPPADEQQADDKETPEETSVDATSFDDLPSAPSDDLPTAPSTATVPGLLSDDDLEARLASLSLPSTPSNKPGSTKAASSTKKKSNLPTYTDEDIESWCVICNEDATVRCLGCEGDLYCQECWAEGHTGPDAGYDEKRHKAVVYNRGEGKSRKRSLAAA